jgi:uncharacterized protein YdcH (DUF465 family)
MNEINESQELQKFVHFLENASSEEAIEYIEKLVRQRPQLRDKLLALLQNG